MQTFENDKLDKNHFDKNALKNLIGAVKRGEVESTRENAYTLQVLSKIEQDLDKIPHIYQKYCNDIHFACTSGLDVAQEELAAPLPENVYSYAKFREYFDRLKELVKEHENEPEFILDLVSAKDRIESLCVVLLEAEANLKKCFSFEEYQYYS